MTEEKQGMMSPDKLDMVDFRILRGGIESELSFEMDHIEGFQSDVDFELEYNLDECLVKADFKVTISTDSDTEQNEAT